MREETATLYSDGLAIDASFFHPQPEQARSDTPLVLICSGYTGMMHIHPARFARAFTSRGYSCCAFDYRGFGKSEGPKDIVLMEEQVRDVANALSFFKAWAEGEARKVVLAGWGMGAALVIAAAKLTGDADALICMNGFYNTVRCQRAVRGQAGWIDFSAWVARERRHRSRTGEDKPVDPFDIYCLDPASREYVETVLKNIPGYGLHARFSFVDSLYGFEVESDLERLAGIPLLVAHGRNNALHPIEEARSLFEKAPGPKEIFILEGAGHTEWMHDDHPRFVEFARAITDWMETIH
jgi:pimeloyl-ACP methyl ester carboxylesterase